MTAEPFIDGLARAIDATGELIASVGEDQWSNSTPCPDFNARALINHLVFGNRLFGWMALWASQGLAETPCVSSIS